MKTALKITFLLITASLLMIGCSALPDAGAAEACPTCPAPVEAQPDPAAECEPPAFDAAAQHEVHLLQDPANPDLTDVYFQNLSSKHMHHIASLTGVNDSHYHHYEFYNDSLYILLRTGDDMTDNWSDELWRYTADGQGSMLYSAKGIDFRTAPGQTHVAVASEGPTGDSVLTMLDPQGTILQQFTPQQLLPPFEIMEVGLQGWSSDGSTLWVQNAGPALVSFSRINVASWEIVQFDVTNLGLKRSDYALNPESGLLAFSDYPMMFDVFSAQEFQASQADVTLSVFNLQTQTLQQIAVSKAQQFRPKWLDAATLEYTDPNNGARVMIAVQ